MSAIINVIDLFAGPGGLGEGFSSYSPSGEATPFHIRMSVEKEASAHKTLTLRAFFRLLRAKGDIRAYMDYVAGRITREQLAQAHPQEWETARVETMEGPTALGDDNDRIHERLHQLKREHAGEPWIVIGGPPCQAYSLVGRARNRGIEGYRAEDDHRHFLYQEYLRVLSIIQPDVFVMENVKGILSSRVGDERIFPTIRRDLGNPSLAVGAGENGRAYDIYSFVKAPDGAEGVSYRDDHDFIIRAEQFGVPQARHRVILLGVARDINAVPAVLEPSAEVPIEQVIAGLPELRSKLSKQADDCDAWSNTIISQAKKAGVAVEAAGRKDLVERMAFNAGNLRSSAPVKSNRYPDQDFSAEAPDVLRNWLLRDRPEQVLNHEARGHMAEDLGRYFFSACWAQVYKGTDKPFPKAGDYPEVLAPNHENWLSGHFSDRFRVQTAGRPATTVTSHISKDGHYFIHPDPKQCRSLTVREAARIQTFPDNYLFEGNRTQQYVQVGNAVPPFLARQLAHIVWNLMRRNKSQQIV